MHYTGNSSISSAAIAACLIVQKIAKNEAELRKSDSLVQLSGELLAYMSVNDAVRIVTEGLIFIYLDMLVIKHKEHMYRIVCL